MMDAESLKSLTWLIVCGGLFYLMMRYGCGAHMIGGRNHSCHDKLERAPAKPEGGARGAAK